MQFKSIYGQQEIKQRLRQLVAENRLPHALMLHGPDGTGKRQLAIALLQYLACTNRAEEDACGQCPSCLKFEKLVHPDLHLVFPVLKPAKWSLSANPTSDDFVGKWREALSEHPYFSEQQWYEVLAADNKQGLIYRDESLQIIRKLGSRPYESEYRMMLIWLPEKMHPSAANKLLKIIEEPPPKTHILMVSRHTEEILPTILSRTQLMHVPPHPQAIIREAILARGEHNDRLVEDAVKRANGNFNTALQTLEQDASELDYFQRFTSLMRLCYSRAIIDIDNWVNDVANLGRVKQKQLLDYSLRLLRENFMMHMDEPALNYLSSMEADFSKKFSPFIHERNVFILAEEFQEAANHIEANGYSRVVFMDLAIKVIRALIIE
ncbi:MAG: DNA polymerase III subunit delta [Bacteroidetes bacterium]|nr:MAG: DNA polymerase III subunit delta [Bacteroidota bacterium]